MPRDTATARKGFVMNARSLAPLALTALLSACAGGGSSGEPVAPIAPPVAPGSATFPLSIVIPARLAPSSAGRAPRYVSPGTASVAVYDGTTQIYVGNFNAAANPQFTTVFAASGATTASAGTCTLSASSATCTITITTTIGAHSFDLITYPGAQGSQGTSIGRSASDVTLRGVILSEGELAVNLSPGTNPGQTITLLGVADQTVFTGPVLTQHLNGNGPLVGIIGTTYTFQYTIDDSSSAQGGGFQIIQPGNYDNGPVTIAETDAGNIVTMTPISQAAPPASAGAQSFTVTCANNGTATITAAAKTKPNTAYASGLTYSASNYPTGTIGTTTLQCVPNSATLPITVQ
jgi:hypothetical protein